MVDKRLVDFIRDGLRRGYSMDYLQRALVKEGWDIDQVDEAIDIIQTTPPPDSAASTPPLAWKPAEEARQAPPERQAPSGPSRPTGVTVVSCLSFLGGILILITGILILSFVGIVSGDYLSFLNETSIGVPFVSSFEEMNLLTMLGLAFIVMGVIELAGSFLLLKMKKAGWAIITAVGLIQIIGYLITGVISFIISMEIIPIFVFWIIIIGYLFMKRKLFV